MYNSILDPESKIIHLLLLFTRKFIFPMLLLIIEINHSTIGGYKTIAIHYESYYYMYITNNIIGSKM